MAASWPGVPAGVQCGCRRGHWGRARRGQLVLDIARANVQHLVQDGAGHGAEAVPSPLVLDAAHSRATKSGARPTRPWSWPIRRKAYTACPARPADGRPPSVLATRWLLHSSIPSALCDSRITARHDKGSAGANRGSLVGETGEERGTGRRAGPGSGGVPGARGAGRAARSRATARDFWRKEPTESGWLSEWQWRAVVRCKSRPFRMRLLARGLVAMGTAQRLMQGGRCLMVKPRWPRA